MSKAVVITRGETEAQFLHAYLKITNVPCRLFLEGRPDQSISEILPYDRYDILVTDDPFVDEKLFSRVATFSYEPGRAGEPRLTFLHFTELRDLGQVDSYIESLKVRRVVTPKVIKVSRVTEEEVLPVIFGDVPVTSADEEVKVDQLILQGDVLGFVQPGNLLQLFFAWFVPHVFTSFRI